MYFILRGLSKDEKRNCWSFALLVLWINSDFSLWENSFKYTLGGGCAQGKESAKQTGNLLQEFLRLL